MPYIRVEKKRRNPKYLPYDRSDRTASFDGAMPFGSLVRGPVLLIGLAVLLLLVVLLPVPETLIDKLQEFAAGAVGPAAQ